MPVVPYADVPRLVLDEVPEFRPLYDEHVEDNFGEVLPHVLFGDVSRFAVDAYNRGATALAERVIRLMERLARDGDTLTSELVGVSFVGNIGPDDVDDGFFALYGPALRADLKAIWQIIPRRDIAISS